MIRAAHTLARRASRLLSASLILALAGSTAWAGPTNPNHRYEHVGRSVSEVAAMLTLPGKGRSLILTKYGDVMLTVGDRLFRETIHTFPVAPDGLLDATWDIRAPGSILYVTYLNDASPRMFTVARLEMDNGKVLSSETLYEFQVQTSTQNFGGGIAQGGDFKLYVGVGDMGNGISAGQITNKQGKILRLSEDNSGADVPSDNPIPGSPVYASGVRNPTRIVLDQVNGRIYFLDVGPGAPDFDEVNLLGPSLNYGWNRWTGRRTTTGFTDPYFSMWPSPIAPTGLEIYASTNLQGDYFGKVMVSGGDGSVWVLTPQGSSQEATGERLVLAETGEPGALADMDIRPDGYVYVTDPGGDVWRLRNEASAVQEPSDELSIIPLLVRKLGASQIEISVERETGVADYGLYTGDLEQSRIDMAGDMTFRNWYTHPDISTDIHAADLNVTEAMSKFQVNSATLPRVSYFLVSAMSMREETGLGLNSMREERPGGLQTFGCPPPIGLPVGPQVGDQAPEFSVAEGINDWIVPFTVPIVDGPFDIPSMYQCNVIFLDLSAEWCPPCRAQAADSESIYQQFKDRGFVMIHAINAAAPRTNPETPCGVPCAQRWARDFQATFPVLADGTSQAWDNYNMINGWPQSVLISRDGVVVRRFDGGHPRAVIEAEIEAELNR